MLGLALILGLAAAFYLHRLIKRQNEIAAHSQTQTIVVAARPIAPAQRITKEQVTLADWPRRLVPDHSFSQLEAVVDRVSRVEIVPGVPIVESLLAPRGSPAGLAAKIPTGRRAMTVKVDEVIGVAGFVAPGTYVDVVATVMRHGLQDESTSRIILQRVKVLASGTQIENKKDGNPVEVNTVTLEVKPEEAEVLALASNAGKLQLVMRNSADEQREENPTGVTITALFPGFRPMSSIPPPRTPTRPAARQPIRRDDDKPVAPAPALIEVIRGDKRTTEVVQ